MKSFRALIRARTPIVVTGADPEIRNTPWNTNGRDSKPGISFKNFEICPPGGRFRVPLKPVGVPLSVVRSSETRTLEVESTFDIAIAV